MKAAPKRREPRACEGCGRVRPVAVREWTREAGGVVTIESVSWAKLCRACDRLARAELKTLQAIALFREAERELADRGIRVDPVEQRVCPTLLRILTT